MLNLFALNHNFTNEMWFGTYAGKLQEFGYMIQFYQYWKIFGPNAPTDTSSIIMTGRYDDDYDNRKDLFAAIRTHDWTNATDITDAVYQKYHEEVPLNLSAHFSHWRWESVFSEAFDAMDPHFNTDREVQLSLVCQFVCAWSNNELRLLGSTKWISKVELEYQFVKVLPMDVQGRFELSPQSGYDIHLEIPCIDPDDCYDEDPRCSSWANEGLCNNPDEFYEMISVCPQSCNICKQYKIGKMKHDEL